MQKEPSGGGKQKADLRLFSKLEGQIGAAIRATDKLQQEFPLAQCHRDTLRSLKDAIANVVRWRKFRKW